MIPNHIIIKNVYISELRGLGRAWMQMRDGELVLGSIIGSWSHWVCKEDGFHQYDLAKIERVLFKSGS